MFLSKESLVSIAPNQFQARLATSLSFDNLIKKLVEAIRDYRRSPVENSRLNRNTTNLPSLPSQQQDPRSQNAASDSSVPVINDVIKAVLKKRFMKPQKGEAREQHCQMGHKLELPIGKQFMTDVNEKNKLGAGFTIISLHKVGLVGKKNVPLG